MSKPWSERPLWEKVWIGPHSKVYLHAGKIIGHLGRSPIEFYEAAKKLPDYFYWILSFRCSNRRGGKRLRAFQW